MPINQLLFTLPIRLPSRRNNTPMARQMAFPTLIRPGQRLSDRVMAMTTAISSMTRMAMTS